jgi:hypothetical protein
MRAATMTMEGLRGSGRKTADDGDGDGTGGHQPAGHSAGRGFHREMVVAHGGDGIGAMVVGGGDGGRAV